MENNTNISENGTNNNNDELYITYSMYVTYILTAVGIIGNGLSLVVLLLSPKRCQASRLYLIVLAVTDSLVLLFQTGTVLDIFSKHEITCKFSYVRYVLRSFSSYIFAVISIQRFVMVRVPFRSSEYDQTKNGIYHLVSAFIIAAASNLFAIPSIGIISGHCAIKPDYSDIFTYSYLTLNYLCSDVGVAVLVVILTVLTIQGLVKSSKLGVCNNGKSESSLTKMLIVLTVTFIILRLPETVGWLVIYVPYTIMKKSPDDTYNNMRIAHYFFNTLSLINLAINFVIYVVFWPAFRKRFCQMIRKSGRMSLRTGRMSTTVKYVC